MSEHARTLFIETTTRCNLACPMCARNAPGWRGGAADMDPALFERLDGAFRHARAVVLNGMGEPLMHPELPRLVAYARERLPEGAWCGLQSNGLLLDEPLADALMRAGLDALCLSTDGESELGHGKGQEGAAARAAGLLRRAADRAGRRLRLGAEAVLMRANAESLPGLVDWAANLGLDFLLVSHLLPVDQSLEGESLFHPCSRPALEHFARFRGEAERRGLDLTQVPRAAMRFRPSGQEAELLALAGQMHAEAHAKGIWLNLGRLAKTDFADLEHTTAVLEEARSRAAARGLDLRLPEPCAPAAQRCAFIEQDAAFVDWQGGVSPCHFLWHEYACRIFGEPKRVHAVSFGNIAGTPLEELWRGREWTAFREAAASGACPSCGDCDLGMCSDACGGAGPFEQDCLGVPVPCGHCPWAAGQLMCLGA